MGTRKRPAAVMRWMSTLGAMRAEGTPFRPIIGSPWAPETLPPQAWMANWFGRR
jgi:hypothetical protein